MAAVHSQRLFSRSGRKNGNKRNLTKPDIQAAIAKGMEDRSSKSGITPERVLLELGRLAFLDIRKAYRSDGSLRPLHELDDDTAAAIAGMEVVEIGDGDDVIGVTKKIKLSDKKGALDLLMRHLGMFAAPGHPELDAELKRLEIEKRKAELKAMQAGSQSSNAQLLADLIARLPG